MLSLHVSPGCAGFLSRAHDVDPAWIVPTRLVVDQDDRWTFDVSPAWIGRTGRAPVWAIALAPPRLSVLDGRFRRRGRAGSAGAIETVVPSKSRDEAEAWRLRAKEREIEASWVERAGDDVWRRRRVPHDSRRWSFVLVVRSQRTVLNRSRLC